MSENIIYFPGSKEFFNAIPSSKIRKKVEEIRTRRSKYISENIENGFVELKNNVIKFPKNEELEESEISNLKDLFYKRNLELRDMVLNIKNIAQRKRLTRKSLTTKNKH